MKKPAIELEIYHKLSETNSQEWDDISNGQPFQSYQWYAYGEKVLTESGDLPHYLMLHRDGKPIARAAFWWISNEPLPIPSLPLRKALESFQRRWPLLICRSPLANISGLILPEAPLRGACLELITQSAQQELRRRHGSFMMFDFLEISQVNWPDWPAEFQSITVADPGTQLEAQWDDFEGYLAWSSKKNRRNYKHILSLADKSGLDLTYRDSVSDMEATLSLIRNVERKHRSAPNPWFRSMLDHMHMIDSNWLEVHQGQKLVGCLLLLRDGQTQYATAIGLAEDSHDVYLLLLFTALQIACEKKVKRIRLGSGAYEAKRRLGFELEFNNSVYFYSPNPILRLAGRLF